MQKKTLCSNVSQIKKEAIPPPPIYNFGIPIQSPVQESFLKKKMKGNVSMFPNQSSSNFHLPQLTIKNPGPKSKPRAERN
jgi:hypothetical protein